MTTSLLLALAGFAFVTSITPGPNNIMLMSSGATHGFRLTLPHLAGVNVGFLAMVLLIGWGLAGIFAAAPWLHGIIRAVGAVYLLYLAYKIAMARGLSEGPAATKPITFTQAVLFQCVNPKAWTVIVGAVTTYVPAEQLFRNVAIVALIFTCVGLPSGVTWTVFGVGFRKFLTRPLALRAFNVGMAALLVLSLYPTLREMI